MIPRWNDHAQSSSPDPSVQTAVRRLDQRRRSLPLLAHPDLGRGQPRAHRVPGRGRRRGRTRRVARPSSRGAAQEEIQERLEHGAALLQTAPSASWWDVIAFSYPTGFPGLLPADGDGQGPEPEAATV